MASLQETHIFSPRILNTFRAGFSRAGFNYDSALLGDISRRVVVSSPARGPGGIVIGGGVTTTGIAAITAAGPNNAAGVWNRRNLFTYTDNVADHERDGIRSAGRLVSAGPGQRKHRVAPAGQASFASLTTFLQGTVSNFQVVPNATELGWRSLFGAWYVEDTIRLRPNLTLQLGLRHEFTTGWNEVAGRAANYITDANGVLLTEPARGRFRVHRK